MSRHALATAPDVLPHAGARPSGAPARAGDPPHRFWHRLGLGNPLVFALLLAGAALPGLVQVFAGPDDHDIAWLVYAAGRALGGARLYVDIVESNPPLIIALSMPIALVSRLTGLSDVLVFELTTLALIAVALWLCARLLRTLAPAPADAVARRGFIVVALFAVCAVPATSNVFAQREHLLVILLLPYLVAAAARATGRELGSGLALTVGLLAGVGVALKPFFVLPWAIVELYLAVRIGPRRAWLRRENVAIAAVLVLYVAAVLLLTPQYLPLLTVLQAVYADFLPMGYTDILNGWRTLLLEHALLAVFVTRSDERTRELRRIVVLATLGFLAALLVQHKGWEYHWYPPVAGATLLLGIAAFDALHGGRLSWRLIQRPGLVIAAVGFALLGLKVVTQVRAGLAPSPWAPYMRNLIPPATRDIREYASGETVAGLSSLPFPMFPAVNHTGVRWASRFNHLWALNGPYRAQALSGDTVVRYHRRSEMGAAERLVYDGVIEDMLRDPPRLLFVLVSPNGALPHPRFDYVRFFSQDARFAAAMRNYRMIDSLGDYRVYKRLTPAAGPAPASSPAPR